MEFNVESPFSFDLGEDIFPLPSLPSPSVTSPPVDNGNKRVPGKLKDRCRKKPTPNTHNDNGDERMDQQKKKIIHRDVERQRRQEMSSLYNTLRSLLPLEYLKGKRSISDHMQETVNYIQYMQRTIQQLSAKRDELRKLSDETTATAAAGTAETLNSSERDSVVVRAKDGLGIQVVLDTATKHRLPLSIFLQALVAEGLEILSCISNRLNERFIHTIECQPIPNNDGCYQTIDVSQLQHNLANLEYYPLD